MAVYCTVHPSKFDACESYSRLPARGFTNNSIDSILGNHVQEILIDFKGDNDSDTSTSQFLIFDSGDLKGYIEDHSFYDGEEVTVSRTDAAFIIEQLGIPFKKERTSKVFPTEEGGELGD